MLAKKRRRKVRRDSISLSGERSSRICSAELQREADAALVPYVFMVAWHCSAQTEERVMFTNTSLSRDPPAISPARLV